MVTHPRFLVLALSLVLSAPAFAQTPPRSFACTNIMGGNPFRLTIDASLHYTATALPESREPISGEGTLELAEIGVYYHVLDGPLLDDLQVDTIHIMSGNRLTPSGKTGLFDCEKAK